MEHFNRFVIIEKLITPACTFLIGVACSWLYFQYSALNNQKLTIKPQVVEANIALTSSMKNDAFEEIDIEKKEIVDIKRDDFACESNVEANLSLSATSDIAPLVDSLNNNQVTVTEFTELVQSQLIEKQEQVSVILQEKLAETPPEDFDTIVETLDALEELSLYDESIVPVNKIINSVIINNDKPMLERVNLLSYARNRVKSDNLDLLENIVIDESNANPELAWEALNLLYDSVDSEDRSQMLESLFLNNSFSAEISKVLEDVRLKMNIDENYELATALITFPSSS